MTFDWFITQINVHFNAGTKHNAFRVYTVTLLDSYFMGGRFHVSGKRDNFLFSAIAVPNRYDIYKWSY